MKIFRDAWGCQYAVLSPEEEASVGHIKISMWPTGFDGPSPRKVKMGRIPTAFRFMGSLYVGISDPHTIGFCSSGLMVGPGMRCFDLLFRSNRKIEFFYSLPLPDYASRLARGEIVQ